MRVAAAAAVPEDADTLIVPEATDFKSLQADRDDDGRRVIRVGLGSDPDAEQVRIAAGTAHARAVECKAKHVAWTDAGRHPDGVVEGIVLAEYRYKRDDAKELDALTVVGADEATVGRARVLAECTNTTRRLQDEPPNFCTPSRLAEHARGIAAHPAVQCEVLGRTQMAAAKMGSLLAVAQGSDEEPALIVLRHEPRKATGPLVAIVGKGVTYDSGGYSMKPAASQLGMKYDMSGAAAVLGAMEALARLQVPVRAIGIVGAVENLVNGRAFKVGDVITAGDGTTIEITNTDAEGRLVLADCVVHARRLGADRIVDIATLTGGVVTALGSVYAALLSKDDTLAGELIAAGERTGELLWRLPMHRDYGPVLESRYADTINANTDRKAQPVTAAHFIARFAKDTPYAHLDIAGVMEDRGKAYANKGAGGFGTRLLFEWVASHAS